MTGRTLGYSLLGGAAVLALLMLLWLAVSGARGGGIVLGLILLVVLAGPLAVAGVVVLQRQRADTQTEAEFSLKQRVLDADRLFRHELAPELRQLARRPGLPAPQLEDLAEDLERSTYDSAEWYSAVRLTNSDIDALQRYEDLVWERVRLLRNQADRSVSQAELMQQVSALEQALDQRRDLLVRGRRAPAAPPSVLLRSGEPARGLDAIRAIAVGDAITTVDATDFVVEGVATYFAEGQQWKLAHLTPAGAGGKAGWLYVGPVGLELALLDEVQLPSATTALEFHAKELPRVAEGTATTDVESRAGSARGVLVSFARFASEHEIGLLEEWPDGARHAYAGRLVSVSDIEVWPAAAAPRSGGS